MNSVFTRCGYVRELESSTGEATLSIVSEDDAASSTITQHHEYTYASGKLLREVITTTADGTSTTQTLDFFYDSNGTPYAVKIDDVIYYYITNLQGDVMSVVDGSGTVVARYEYDPFGAVISATGDLAEINPLRYRGYYYDQESGLYYLQSRYYDPATCRFINADAYASTGQGIVGFNMFAYCGNNPINCIDASGNDFIHISPIRADEDGARPHLVGASDGQKMSDDLLQYILDSYSAYGHPFEGSIVYASVEYNGIYHNYSNAKKDGFILLLGLGAKVIPHPVASGIGTALDIYAFIDYPLSFADEFPDGEYRQYTATMTWTTTVAAVGYPDILICTENQIQLTYLWNTTHLDSPYWYLLDYDDNSASYVYNTNR